MIKRLLNLPQRACSFFLFGPRQVGKSTLINQFTKQETSQRYDFLINATYNKYASDPSAFREEVLYRSKNISVIILDEIQRIPELLNEVHWLMEHDKKLSFIMSGSSARKLKRAQANLLGGRALNFQLYPFLHSELGVDFDLHKALSIGTLPAIYLEEDHEIAKAKLRSYVETYIEEEIKAEALVRNMGTFLRFLKFAANENGNIINYSNIARETANKAKDVKEYFQILEDTLIGFFLLAYSKSTRKRLIQHPKFYFFDTGVQRALARKLELELERSTYDYGDCFEHFIIKEIIHTSRYKQKDYEFSYYRTENDAEVDLIVETPDGKVYAIEIKSSTNPHKGDLKGLKSFKSVCPQAVCICASQVEYARHYDDLDIVPWQEVFKILGLD